MVEKHILLDNSEEIEILASFPHYRTTEIDYVVRNQVGEEFVLTQKELESLTSKSSREFSKEEKLQLFLTYFQGRKDVYAKRYFRKDGQKGYTPHCGIEWTSQCPKKFLNNPRFDCSKCKYRQLLPYDESAVIRHIQGPQKDYYGIYPLLKDDKTYIIVLDFDKENAELEARAVVSAAQRYHLTCLIERSQSGKGIHLWIFFEKAIPAYLARKLASLLLLDASSHSDVNFMSYDRMIPMQDTLPKGSFGNLIALPLKWENVQSGKSTFLDKNFKIVSPAHLWEHLSSAPRYSQQAVESFVEALALENPIQEYHIRPEKLNPSQSSLPKHINVRRAGELVIPKEKITRKEQIALLYLASFKNPEYYKKQKMRTITWDTPRLITSGREDTENIYLPRGLEKTLDSLIENVEIKNEQTQGSKIELEFKGQLYPEQKEAARAIQNQDIGILCARTGFGKTVVAAQAIAQRKRSTLILVQNHNLEKQWQKRLSEFLDIQTEPAPEYTPTGRIRKKTKIGLISRNQAKQATEIIDVAMMQKLARLSSDDLKELFSHYGFIIIDECHHIAALTFEKVIRLASSKYLLGLSATPEREDGLTPIIFMRCGPIVFESQKLSQENPLLKSYMYPRYTSIGELDRTFEDLSYPEQLNFLSKSKIRNQQIIEDINQNYQEGRTSLVLSERLEHLDLLKNLLDENVKSFTLVGGRSKKQTQAIINELQNEEEAFVLFASSKFVGEGFDLPQLDTLFLTLPFKAKGSHKQYLGRLQRNLLDKDELRVYDYVDISSPLFGSMYQKRLRVYKEMAYELAEDKATKKYQAHLFSQTDYEPAFKDDLLTAKAEINIFVPVISSKLSQILVGLKFQGISVKVDLLASEKLNENLKQHQEKQIKYLKGAGILVQFSENISQSIAIIDSQKMWYGNLNFLTQSTSQATSISFSSDIIADEILKMLEVY
ncbi:MAG: DEAD/DEAH box helicase family protein [Streptococcaceae bacterium]|jgi:superfamily II DNA or RNA helicase|nr:DEAD/DEAH box helicase family protein [Streptococcaceae bacterium]